MVAIYIYIYIYNNNNLEWSDLKERPVFLGGGGVVFWLFFNIKAL